MGNREFYAQIRKRACRHTRTHTHRLTLDKEDILNWGSHTKDDVLLFSCLSAKWENNDAIDKAVTATLGDKKVCFDEVCVCFCVHLVTGTCSMHANTLTNTLLFVLFTVRG